MIVESAAHFPEILKTVAIRTGQMQCAETRPPIAFAGRVADDGAFQGLPRLDLEPGLAALSGEVRAAALFGHDAFETQLLYGVKEGSAFFDHPTHAVRGILLDRVLKPLAPSRERLIDDRAPIQIEAVEEITHGRMLGPGSFDSGFRLLVHAMDHVPEIRLSVRFEADNFPVKQR